MDSGLVSESLSDDTKGDRGNSASLTYTEQFDEQFPHYLAMGMTPEQFWDGDPALVIAYRKADRLKMERMNFSHWLQGMYIYEALCEASPLYHDLAKKGTKAAPYAKEPYPIFKKKEERLEDKQKQQHDRLMEHMKQMAQKFNQKKQSTTTEEVKGDGLGQIGN